MISSFFLASVLFQAQPVEPVRTEVITPIRNATFNKGGKAKKRVQGGNPRLVNGLLVFDGSQDGGRQVDPQIAVGGGFIFHGSNSGFVIYDKKGNYVDGVPQSEFNNGIDPKVLYDVTNKVFCFDLWYYYDGPKLKPVNVSVSETSDPVEPGTHTQCPLRMALTAEPLAAAESGLATLFLADRSRLSCSRWLMPRPASQQRSTTLRGA